MQENQREYEEKARIRREEQERIMQENQREYEEKARIRREEQERIRLQEEKIKKKYQEEQKLRDLETHLDKLVVDGDYEEFLNDIEGFDLHQKSMSSYDRTIGEELLNHSTYYNDARFSDLLQRRGFRLKDDPRQIAGAESYGAKLYNAIVEDRFEMANWIRENYDPELSFEYVEEGFFHTSEEAIRYIIDYYPAILEDVDFIQNMKRKKEETIRKFRLLDL